MNTDQLKAMIKSLHGTRDQYGRLALKAEQSRIQQRNDSSSERDRCEMGQTMCTILISACEAALAVTPSPQPRAFAPVTLTKDTDSETQAWRGHD